MCNREERTKLNYRLCWAIGGYRYLKDDREFYASIIVSCRKNLAKIGGLVSGMHVDPDLLLKDLLEQKDNPSDSLLYELSYIEDMAIDVRRLDTKYVGR